MNIQRVVSTIVVASMALTAMCLAGNPKKRDPNGRTSITTVEHYAPILINNVFNYYGNNGDGSYNKYISSSAFEFPKGSNKTAVFQDGIVWGGFHKGRANPKVGGSVYRHALQPGRIITAGGPTEIEAAVPDDPMKPEYRVFRVRPDIPPSKTLAEVQTALNEEAALIGRFEASGTAQALFDAYVKDWNEWPAKTVGNPAGLAPFTDMNGNGTYEPAVDVPGEQGASQTLHFVANDLNASLTQNLAGCPPIGLEVHRTFWGYDNAGALGNTVFCRTLIINRSGAPVDSMVMVQWVDPDVGYADDDMVGCDPTRDLGFAYNGLPADGVYGTAVPAVGYELLQGPIVPSPGDSALFRASYRHGYRNLGMTAFVFFSQGFAAFADPWQGVGGDVEWYRLMNGLTAKAGIPFIDPTTNEPTKFSLSGDPVTGQGWLDGEYGLTPADRRMCLVTGPFRLANADTQEIVVATFAGLGGDRLSSVAVLKYYADQLKTFYGSLQHKIPPICAANVSYVPSDSALVTLHVDASAERPEDVNGIVKDASGSLIAAVAFFDDATHGDAVAGDRIFTNQIVVARSLRPLSLDITTTSTTGGTTTWARILPAITVAGPVAIDGPDIFSDNINSDGQSNFGENIRFGVFTTNATAFPLDLHISSTSGDCRIPSLLPGETRAMSYDPDDPGTYFTVDLPRSTLDSICIIPFAIFDTLGNYWKGSVTFNVIPVSDTIKSALLAHPSGIAWGSFDVSIVDKSEVRNHLYVIQGVDSINSLGESGFTLKDSTDGRVLLVNHPLPDSLGHNIPVTDGFKILRGTTDRGHGYKSYEVPKGRRVWSWVNGDDLGLEGLNGAIGAACRTWYSSSTVDLRHVTSVLIRFAATDDWGYLVSSDDTLASYAYRYVRHASSGPQRPEFAPYMLNMSPGYAYQDYNRTLPFAVYDLGKDPPVRLMVGYMENNKVLGTVDGRYWPPVNTDTVDNIRSDGPREWFFIFNEPYSVNPSPTFQVDILNTTVPMMWYGTPTRRAGTETFRTGDELIIRAFMPPTSKDIWTFNPEIVVSVEEQAHPLSSALLQNYPNPFNPVTRIRYAVGGSGEARAGGSRMGASRIKLVVYDLLGREVATLVNEEQQPGTYEVPFDGSHLASGVYFYRLQVRPLDSAKGRDFKGGAGDFVQTRKLLLMK